MRKRAKDDSRVVHLPHSSNPSHSHFRLAPRLNTSKQELRCTQLESIVAFTIVKPRVHADCFDQRSAVVTGNLMTWRQASKLCQLSAPMS